MKQRNVVVFDPVYGELSEAVGYYESKKRGLGLRFYLAFEKALETLALNADGYEKKHRNNRQIVIEKFPFVIVFEVREANN